MDRFDTMLAFTRVVELNSFTKASVSLNLPKATLSAQVLALEKRLRVKLLHRTTRHVSVTPDGAAYYERAIRILNDLEETEASLMQMTAPSGRLRVDVPGVIGRRVIIPALADFYQRYPEIRLELGCSDRPVDLVQEGIDCVIRGGDILDESLAARRLGDIELVAVAAPSYLEKHGLPKHPSELEHHQMIGYVSARSGKVYGFEYIENGLKQEVHGQNRLALNDTDAVMEAALAGLGVAQISAFVACEHITAGRLVHVLPEVEAERVPLCILYPQNRHLSIKVRAFIEWSAELFAKSRFILPSNPLRRAA